MYLSRFDHEAAREAAVEHASTLHAERLQRSLAGLFGESADRQEIERAIAELELRERALLTFAQDPYAADSLQRIFDREDRRHVLAAGSRGSAEGARAA